MGLFYEQIDCSGKTGPSIPEIIDALFLEAGPLVVIAILGEIRYLVRTGDLKFKFLLPKTLFYDSPILREEVTKMWGLFM